MMPETRFLILIALLAVSFAFFGCTGQTAPEPPTGLSATAISGGIKLAWSPSPTTDVSGYNIYRSNAEGTLGGKINGGLINDVSYTDTDVQDGNTYYYTVRAVDSKGAEETNTNQTSATAHTAAPSGLSISINSGASYTTSSSVTLALSASGASECRLSNDGTNWGVWTKYSTQESWQLSSGDGNKTVYYECRNAAGIESTATYSSIYLKTSGPSISVSSPSENDILATSFNLTFTVTDAIGNVSCNAYADGSVAPIGQVQAGTAKSVPMILADGLHAVYVQCSDTVNSTKSSEVHFETEQDAIELTINNGATSTPTSSVTLNIYAPSAAQCRYSNDGRTYTSWETYSQNRGWTLTSGQGVKKVYVECKTSGGTSLGVVSDQITVQSTLSVSLSINNDDSETRTRTVMLSIAAPSATQCRFGDGKSALGSWETYSQNRWYTLPTGDGRKYVYAECRNNDGVVGDTYASIVLKQNPSQAPDGLSININGGASRTESRYVNLYLDARNADQCRFGNEDGTWSVWYNFARAWNNWQLSSGYGRKTVYYQCENDYGTSNTVSASITYGVTQPTVSILAPQSGYTYTDELDLTISTSGTGTLSCTYYCNGASNDFGSVSAGSQGSHLLLAPLIGGVGSACGTPTGSGNGYSTYVTCSDDYGNTGTSATVNFLWSRE